MPTTPLFESHISWGIFSFFYSHNNTAFFIFGIQTQFRNQVRSLSRRMNLTWTERSKLLQGSSARMGAPGLPTWDPGKWEIPNYKPYSSRVFMGKLSPRIPRKHNKNHGYSVRGTPNCPLTDRAIQFLIYKVGPEPIVLNGVSYDPYKNGLING